MARRAQTASGNDAGAEREPNRVNDSKIATWWAQLPEPDRDIFRRRGLIPARLTAGLNNIGITTVAVGQAPLDGIPHEFLIPSEVEAFLDSLDADQAPRRG